MLVFVFLKVKEVDYLIFFFNCNGLNVGVFLKYRGWNVIFIVIALGGEVFGK